MEKSRRTTQLLLLNSLTCGLEICVAAGITYVPPLLLEAGVEEKFMTMVLGIGPVLGLIFVPLIGSKSDHWTSKYGRRRPFIWALCLGVLLSLFAIPHASRLAAAFSFRGRRVDVAFLVLGICLLDFCGQVCFTPLEALLSDMFHDAEDCRRAFSMYSFMISLGGCIGYLLTAIDWERTSLSLYLGGQAECLFTLLAAIFVVCVLGTFFVAEETHGAAKPEPPAAEAPSSSKEVLKPLALYCCSVGAPSWRARNSLAVLRNCCTLIPRLYPLYGRIPKVIRQLVVAEFYSWMALMTFMMFYTDFVGEGLYHGVPNAEPGSEARVRYDEGLLMISTVELGVVSLYGVKTKVFIAMNKKGRLYSTTNFNHECKFKEQFLPNSYNAYESKAYTGMYIALSKHGRAKRGSKVSPVQRVSHFLPRK